MGQKVKYSRQCGEQQSCQEIWDWAQQWVEANQKLIRQIATPYRRFMAGDNQDLYQEATIAAYKAFISTREKGSPERFTPFFRVIFQTNCIKLSSGIQTVHCMEDYFLPLPEQSEMVREPKKEEVQLALSKVTARQREVCLWILSQPTPASTPDIANQFKVSRRHACRLVSNSIQTITGASNDTYH